MKLIERISEDEMISEFLRAEINSSRYRNMIIENLGVYDEKILTEPDLHDEKENQVRRQVISAVRGYSKNEDLFEDFPTNMSWYKAIFTVLDLTNVMYIDYSYWNELSLNTRLPKNSAQNILAGVEIYNVSNQGFIDMNHEIEMGKTYPKMIFVARNEKSRIVILEGHARMTAYFLKPQNIPEELEVIIGYSEGIANWGLY